MKYLICLISASVLISCQSPKTEFEKAEPVSQYLLYISNKEGGFNIYKNDLTGSQEIALTQQEGWEWYPQYVHPLGAIVYNRQDTSGVFTVKAMTTKGEPLDFDTMGLPSIEASLNSQWLAYTRKKGESTQIMITNLITVGDSLQITQNEYYNGRPKWDGEGEKLAYISDRSGSNEIYIYNRLSQQTQRITENKLREKYLSWSPDGKTLATTMQTDSTENDIYLINLENLFIEQITTTPVNESEIAWSLDGQYIAYHAQVDEKDDIYVLRLEDKTITKITDGEGYYGEPNWCF